MDQPATFDAWDFERSSHTVIFDHAGYADAEWLAAVAAGEEARRMVVVRQGTPPSVFVVGAAEAPNDADLQAAGAVLVELGAAAPGSPLENWSVVFEQRLPDPIEDAPRTKRRLFSVDGLDAHLKAANETTARDLVTQLRSPMRVMPFVGAGLSAPFGYPAWERFLREAGDEFQLADEVAAELAKGEYAEAAELLKKSDPAAFTEKVRTTFADKEARPDLTGSALSYLPLLTDGPIITTNFDGLIEQAFEAAGRPLKDPIDGPRELPTLQAIHRNEPRLLKIHGLSGDPTFRVFTTEEFEKGYQAGKVTLTSLALLTFTNRPLLILGASLTVDRTVEVIDGIHQRHEGLWHYAILEASYSEPELKARQKQIRRLGIRPLWYPAGRHERVPELLRETIERAGARELRKRTRPPGVGARDDVALRGLNGLPIIASAAPQTRAIAQAIRGGRVSLFLGTYAHLSEALLAESFYGGLAEEFEVPVEETGGGRGDIARYVSRERPSHVLSKAVRERLQGLAPTVVHEFAAALPGYLRSRSAGGAAWYFTTNYDTALEDALTAAEEPFHVLYYHDREGRFAHVARDGAMRLIERPEVIGELDGTTVVKLNGGLSREPELEESTVVASGQHERLADRIPHALPACMRAVVRTRSMLFLGHSLTEPDVRQLVEYAVLDSWAVRPRPEDANPLPAWQRRTKSLQDLRVETVDSDLKRFLSGLRLALLQL